ncbi:MerR family transcriptional regulator [Fodinicurvata fenggangensis]|uniref:MerR family transcriptional regulator n=1 Tax=Fodinicurvata fenggangensis TaxID=1121830 RepID=UPI00047D1D94|nr:helix-turn-helix domain-containing protein [Fodinicurvata fenggangensis]
MTAAQLSIGDLARDSGVKVQTIRYYETIGLLPVAERSAGNQRRYSEAHRERLRFLRHARELGFTLDQIRSLLSLSESPDMPCEQADRIAREHLETVEQRLERLKTLQTELQRMLRQCAGGKVEDCRVIEVLSDHTLCATEHGHREVAETPAET